jgi:predicted dehydrogenase
VPRATGGGGWEAGLMLKIGLIGAGYWGPNLARVLNQSRRCEFSACCDIDPRNVEKVVRQYPTLRGFSRASEMWESDVDAVVIATPIGTHFELAKQALKSGKHVLAEKPLAHNSSCCEELLELAERNNLVLMTGHTFIFSPPVIKVKELVESGALGDLYYISLSRVNLGLYQKDVDVIWDLAVHDISILLYWLNEMPTQARAFGRACVQKDKNDVAFIWLQFGSGLIASIEISWLSPQKLRRSMIVGSKRMVVYDDTEPNEKIKIYDRGVILHEPENFGEFQLTYRLGDMVVPNLSNVEPLLAEIEHFVECVETGARPKTNGVFATNVVRILETAVDSMRDGTAIPSSLRLAGRGES